MIISHRVFLSVDSHQGLEEVRLNATIMLFTNYQSHICSWIYGGESEKILKCYLIQ